jgi:hypothetical protein
LYWYFWFRGGPDQERRRRAIIAIIFGTLLALAINRAVSSLTPFRVRPMFDMALQHRPLAVEPHSDLEDWSSYPSDHAAYLCALAFGLICLARKRAVPIILYAVGWICLPRMYLGIHFASDIAVGALIGVATILVVLRLDWIRSSLASRVLDFVNARPQWFYMVAFLILFEMGGLFGDVRGPVHLLLHAGSGGPYHKIILCALLLFAAVCAGITVRLFAPRFPWKDGWRTVHDKPSKSYF